MNVGVVGSGIMGNGIAQVIATSGHAVTLVDNKIEQLEYAKKTIKDSLLRIIRKQEKPWNLDDIMNRIESTTDKQKLKSMDIVIEAVTEKIDIKKEVFKELDDICNEKTIFASNTSGLSVTEIAFSTNRPEQVCGLHFFNPVPVMKLVEIVTTDVTSKETINFIENLVKEMNKESIKVMDTPLFVVNRILVPMINEAIFVLEEGIATKEDIDKGMMLGASHPIGPLKLADYIGLDTLLYVQETLYTETGDSKYRVPKLLKKLVRAGQLGRKTGKGFYDYTSTTANEKKLIKQNYQGKITKEK
jgi:3-hydroxybutyryl-CoA dehydrogenase